jgi:hypothetical protein
MVEDIDSVRTRIIKEIAIQASTEGSEQVLSRCPRTAYATADLGADTNVLGRKWLIIAKDAVRNVNLMGFDAEHVRKKGLSEVNADTIVMTIDWMEIILGANLSVSNPSTTTALLSEVQLGHAGCGTRGGFST